MSEQIPDIELRIEAIQAQYENLVGSRPRTADLIPVLTALKDEVEETIEATKLMDPLTQAEAVSRLSVYRDQYQSELASLQTISAQLSPNPTEKHVAMWGNALYGAYRRHFAGHPRETRDVELLVELQRILMSVSGLLNDLPQGDLPQRRQELHAILAKNRDLFEEETQKIRESQTLGNLDEQVNHLALAANNIFAIYGQFFSGKARHTRRPALLSRAITSLESILAHMRRIKDQDDSFEMNQQNIDIIVTRLTSYGAELAAITNARQGATLEQIMGGLANEANELFSEYRDQFADQDRATRDLTKLGAICDHLLEIAIQMKDLEGVSGNEMNRKNLDIVLQNLSLYDHEYVHIEKAREN